MHLASSLRVRPAARTAPRWSPQLTRRVGTAVLLLALLAGSWLWLRDSRLVGVRQVTVTGVTSSQEGRVREALESAAREMTTLHVRQDELRAAVEPYASVAQLRVDADFPRALAIEVVERTPAAVVVAGGERVPVSAGGLLLRGLPPAAGLPELTAPSLPAGPRLTDARSRAAVAVLAGAPAPVRGRVARVRYDERGLTLDLRDGPDLVFGSVRRVQAKWLAANRVLADSSAQGATYLDLRLPEWTAAGGKGPVEPEVTPAPTVDAAGAADAADAPQPQP